jgi:NAD(P)-dependent dehydrogenase (short-subunit alcohol dehydrogenase family)
VDVNNRKGVNTLINKINANNKKGVNALVNKMDVNNRKEVNNLVNKVDINDRKRVNNLVNKVNINNRKRVNALINKIEVNNFYIPLPLLSSKWTLLSNTRRLTLSLELIVYTRSIYTFKDGTLKVKPRLIIKEEL